MTVQLSGVMNSNWQLIKESFHAALALDGDAREKFIGGLEVEIGEEVRSLVASHESASDLLETPVPVELGYEASSFVGLTIGGYELLELVGTGGMGAVYRARKVDSDQDFAVKIVKRGMDSDTVLRRFALERRILASLSHPNIARLIDGGTTATGQPYFVMEFVAGEPLIRFCETQQLSLDERLAVFTKVCDAVDHAHRNLVVHRDLKPSNILVTKDGEPKLLDFGIAKLLDAEDSGLTRTGGRLFTPEYASPEQVLGLPITTTTDVYSLGVLLYELVSGRRPFSSTRSQALSGTVTETGLDAVQTPPAPSAVTATGTFERELRAGRNYRRLATDLDNIVLMALRREAERRYASVADLRDDLIRLRGGLPVTATADSVSYRLKKFLSRNRPFVIGAAAAVLLVASASGVAVWQALRAFQENARAERRFVEVRRIAKTVLFDYHDAIREMPGATAIRERMIRDSVEYLDNLAAESNDDPELRREVALAYRKAGDVLGSTNTGNVGRPEESVSAYRKSIAIWETLVADGLATEDDRLALAQMYFFTIVTDDRPGSQDSVKDAFAKASILIDSVSDGIPKEDSRAKFHWQSAMLNNQAGAFSESESNLRKSVEIYRKLMSENPAEARFARNYALMNKNLGSVLLVVGKSDDALTCYEQALLIDRARSQASPDEVGIRLDLSFTLASLASLRESRRQFTEAIELYREAVGLRSSVASADPKNVFAHEVTAEGRIGLARVLLITGQAAAAETEANTAITMLEKIIAANSPQGGWRFRLAQGIGVAASAAAARQRDIQAEQLFARSDEIFGELLREEKIVGIQKRQFAQMKIDRAEFNLSRGRKSLAQAELSAARELLADPKVVEVAKAELARIEELSKK